MFLFFTLSNNLINILNLIYLKMTINNFKRNIDYIKTSFFIMWRRLIEYKINFYFGILEQLSYFVFQYVFFFVVFSSFGDIIGWEFIDYILFFLLIDLIRVTAGLFIWKRGVGDLIIDGGLNVYLARPISVFIKHYFSEIEPAAIFYVITDIIAIGLILFFIKVEYFSLFIFLLLLLIYLTFISYAFLDSFSFFKKKLGSVFVYTFYNPIMMVMDDYPAQFFKKLKYKQVLNIFPVFYVGLLLIPLLRGYEIDNLLFYINLIISLSSLFTLLTLIIWHKGLKKYEAYG